MSEPRFTDFRAIADEIRNQPEYALLGRLLDRAALAQSCLGDLAEAQSCIDALNELLASPRKRGTEGRQTTEAALMRSAILLYQRATTGGGGTDQRGSIDIRASLSPEQREDHDTIVDIRHRTIGHVIPGEIDGDQWHQSFLLGLAFGPAWQPTFMSKRVQVSPKAVERLRRQVAVGSEVMLAKFDKALERVVDTMNDHPLPAEVYERHVVDNEATFGSVARARAIAASRDQRRASILG